LFYEDAYASRETGDARKAVELLAKAVKVAEESTGYLREKEVDIAESRLEVDKSGMKQYNYLGNSHFWDLVWEVICLSISFFGMAIHAAGSVPGIFPRYKCFCTPHRPAQ
jgi:hypothetical protein